jgi:formylglycine-generating enzyme required for sulfatase activity
VIAYDALTRLGRQWKSEAEPLQSFLRSEASRLLEKISLIETPHWRRAEIGDRLARIGDPRRGVGLSENGLPDIVWCRIPSGTVTLEDDDGTLEDNAETFEVEFFEIARFPVTYRQYRAFVEAADGYRDGRWWRGLRHEAEPGVPHRTTNNCPADHVSWHDAVAFCRWLSARFWEQGQLASKNIIRLPAEWEWQQAATRGSAGREYPWGEWDERFANSSESQLARTTAVGMYPHAAWAGDAPLDMTGNVFEWCRNKYEKPKVTIADESKDARVLRGGSWYDRRREARCSYRDSDHPGVRCGSVGFRVVCSFTID